MQLKRSLNCSQPINDSNSMTKKENALIIADEIVMSKIYFIRGQKVMLDSDLAELYLVETKRLKEQVKRNISRFPTKYMFNLTEKEFESLRSQFVTSKNCQTTLFSGDFKRNRI